MGTQRDYGDLWGLGRGWGGKCPPCFAPCRQGYGDVMSFLGLRAASSGTTAWAPRRPGWQEEDRDQEATVPLCPACWPRTCGHQQRRVFGRVAGWRPRGRWGLRGGQQGPLGPLTLQSRCVGRVERAPANPSELLCWGRQAPHFHGAVKGGQDKEARKKGGNPAGVTGDP